MESGDVAMLVAVDGPERGRPWPLGKEVVVIGRSADADVVIPDRRVSGLHAEVVCRGGRCFLRDLGSKNGTFVNGERLDTSRVLEDGDEVQLAVVVRFRFVGSGNTVPLTLAEALQPGLRFDEQSRQVWINGRELRPPLSQAQFRLLQLLVEGDGAVCSRDEIAAAVWPDEAAEGITEQAIDALVRRLRERLAELDPQHSYVVTVRGHGFRFERSGV